MNIRFRRTLKLAPGVRLNLGSRSAGISLGPRGLHVGVNTKKGPYASAGIPGTGLYAVHHVKRTPAQSEPSAQPAGPWLGTILLWVVIVIVAIKLLFEK